MTAWSFNERIGERHPHIAGVAEAMKKQDGRSFAAEANVPTAMMMSFSQCRRRELSKLEPPATFGHSHCRAHDRVQW
jgi:hypothetical protein